MSQVEYLSRQELETRQLSAFRKLLLDAQEQTVFYKHLLSRYRKDILRINSLADIRAIPFTLPADLQKHPLDFLTFDPGLARRIFLSSGSTGLPKVTFLGQRPHAVLLPDDRQERAEGFEPGDRVAVLTFHSCPANFKRVPHWRDQGIDAVLIPQDLLQSSPRFLFDFLKQAGITVIYSHPNFMFELTLRGQELGIDLAALLPLKFVLLSGSTLTRNIRRYVEEIWRAPVFTNYGCNEAEIVAYECPAHDGMHVNADIVLLEIIDPDSGEPVDDGEVGEVVISTLLYSEMPFVRYRLGDLARRTYENCSCGRTLPRLWHMGRVRERLKVRNLPVFVYPWQVHEAIESFAELTGRFVLVASRTNTQTDLFCFQVEAFGGSRPQLREVEDAIGAHLAEVSPGMQAALQRGQVAIQCRYVDPMAVPHEWGRKPQSLLMDQRNTVEPDI